METKSEEPKVPSVAEPVPGQSPSLPDNKPILDGKDGNDTDHHHHHHHGHDKEKEGHRSRSKDHHHSKHHSHHRSHREKSGSREEAKVPERRKRSRTRSPNPLLKSYEKIPDKRYGEQKMFWDGFQWVSRATPIVRNFEQVTNTKKIQISGLPLELGLRADDIRRDFNSRLKEKYKLSKDIIQQVTLILAQNAVGIELGSREDIPKIKETFEGMEMLGQALRVTSFEDKTINFNVSTGGATLNSLSNPLANSAQTAAQAAAIATAALRGMQGQDVKISLQGTNSGAASKVVKVSNVVDPIDAQRLWGAELQEIKLDMKDELGSFGRLLDIRIVDPKKEILGAEGGAFLAQYEEEKAAEQAAEKLRGRKYDGKIIHVAFVKPELYEKEFKPISESFIDLDAQTQPQPQVPAQEAPKTAKEADYEFEQH